MAQITLRQIPDEVHRALKARAKQEGVSAETKARQIPADQPPSGRVFAPSPSNWKSI